MLAKLSCIDHNITDVCCDVMQILLSYNNIIAWFIIHESEIVIQGGYIYYLL